jgi:hypothetical protein
MSTKITRNLLRQYYGIGATPTYHLCTPFTKLNEENSPEKDDSAFINDVNGSPTIVGYKNAFGFEAQVHEGDPVVDDLILIAREQKVGSDCEKYVVDVDMNKPTEGVSGSYYARKFAVAVECTPPAGDPKAITKITGSMHQIGDVVIGSFNPTTKVFVAASAPTTYAVTMTVVPATAEVIVRDADGAEIAGVSVNELTGVVAIPNLPNGTYEYIVFKDGYITEQTTFTVESATKAIGTITIVSGT